METSLSALAPTKPFHTEESKVAGIKTSTEYRRVLVINRYGNGSSPDFVVGGPEGGGEYSALRYHVKPGDEPPLRTQTHGDEMIYMVDGQRRIGEMRGRTYRRLATVLLVLAISPLLYLASFAQNNEQDTDSFRTVSARYTEDGELIRPDGWRKWVYVGTPVTPHDMNNGQAAFPEFHNVYIDPDSFATYEQTGEFPEGTMIAKELVLVGSKAAVSGNGYFMGEFAGLEVSIKDSERFKDEPGGWAYFSFGHQAEYAQNAKMFETSQCNACHDASADQDFVFTQYYPVLRAANPKGGKPKDMSMKMDDNSRSMAISMLGDTTEKKDDYSVQLFKWLQEKKYGNYKAESAIHESASFAAHGDVRTFANQKLVDSLEAGKESHPVGSVIVKELYKEEEHIGWAVSLKVKEDKGDGTGWYWYENLSTTDSSKPVAAGLGANLCTGCHKSGTDFVLTKQIR